MLSLLFGFRGRINRAQYWLGGVGSGVAILLFLTVLIALGGPVNPGLSKDQQMAHFFTVFALALVPALMVSSWIGYALAWKRFHDRGKSGVWVFLPMLPSFMLVSSVFGAIASGADPVAVAGATQPWMGILWIIQIWFFIELGCLPSKQGPNKYGDQPGGGSAPAGRAPTFAPSAPAKAGVAIPGMASSLGSAESAMERAIAERAKQALKAAQPAQRAAPRPPASPATGQMRPATPGSFGRKVTQ